MAAAGGMDGDDDNELGACGGADDGVGAGPSGIQNYFDDNDMEEDGHLPAQKKPSIQRTSSSRPRCQYGEDCYRKNPYHFKTYCHPKDREWGINDTRRPKARCPFGDFCTR